MKCLSDKKIIEYLDGALNSVDTSMIRDHLIVCEMCKKKSDFYNNINEALLEPIMISPPKEIAKNVINRITKGYSYISSLISLIFVSFLMLIAGIYIYFDFANDSIIKALKVTSEKTSTLISTFVNFVESVFHGMNIVFKALNVMIEALVNVNLGVEITGLIFTSIILISFYLIFRKIQHAIRNSR